MFLVKILGTKPVVKPSICGSIMCLFVMLIVEHTVRPMFPTEQIIYITSLLYICCKGEHVF